MFNIQLILVSYICFMEKSKSSTTSPEGAQAEVVEESKEVKVEEVSIPEPTPMEQMVAAYERLSTVKSSSKNFKVGLSHIKRGIELCGA